MRRIVLPLVTVAALVIAALSAGRAAADDETDEIEIKIHAPLDASDCGATPPTIRVLGLTIDVATVAIGAESDGEGGGSCAALMVGQSVEVKLVSDTPDPTSGLLAAAAVHQSGDDNAVEVQAPIQEFDATAKTITLLGRTVDIRAAHLDGAADENYEGDWRPIPFSDLMVGQSVEVKLDADQLPNLVATNVEVKNITNEVDVELDDGDEEVYDDDEDVDVSVNETVSVQNPLGGRRRRVKKVVHFHLATRGSFTLSGLPTGRAKILVTRTNSGVTTVARRTVTVKPNDTRDVVMRLRALSRRR